MSASPETSAAAAAAETLAENGTDKKDKETTGDTAATTTAPAPTLGQTITNLEKARTRVKKAFARSKLLDAEQDHLYPRFEWSEITTGEILGVGGFGTVKEITSISIQKPKRGPSSSFSFRSWAELTGTTSQGQNASVGSSNLPAVKTERPFEQQQEDDDDDDEDDLYYDECFQDKRFIADNTRRKGGDARYAIKYISPNVKENPKKFLQAAMDMAIETQFLSVLQHEHLVRMRGVGQGDMFDAEYFLVLDRLYDTLEERFDTWKEYADSIAGKGFIAKLKKLSLKRKQFFNERLSIMKDLASALAYLHNLNIIYRDFKPDNAGFDVRGNVKLFDFGLAKELHEDDKKANGTWRLTGETGAVRYMAPEVATRRPYNFRVDTYSFAIVMWQTLALEVPYLGFNKYQMTNMVGNFGERPKLHPKWSPEIKALLESCWAPNYRKRPGMQQVHDELNKIVQDGDSDEEDSTRVC